MPVWVLGVLLCSVGLVHAPRARLSLRFITGRCCKDQKNDQNKSHEQGHLGTNSTLRSPLLAKTGACVGVGSRDVMTSATASVGASVGVNSVQHLDGPSALAIPRPTEVSVRLLCEDGESDQSSRTLRGQSKCIGCIMAVATGVFSSTQNLLINVAKKYERDKLNCNKDFTHPAVCLEWKERFNPNGSWIMSFAIGTLLITLLFFLGLVIFTFCTSGSGNSASGRHCDSIRSAMPKMHWSIMKGPGFLSGLLWSISNYFIIMGVVAGGNSIEMAQINSCMLLTSGCWGIFYYREIEGVANIALWFFFAFATLGFIALLEVDRG